MLVSRRITRSQYRRRSEAQSSSSDDGSNGTLHNKPPASELPNTLQAQHAPPLDPLPAEKQALPTCSFDPSDSIVQDVHKKEEDLNVPDMSCPAAASSEATLSHSLPSSSSSNQNEASSSASSVQSARVMRCTSPSISMRCSSPLSGDSHCSNAPNVNQLVMPARFVRCPVRPAKVMRCDRSSLVKPSLVGSSVCDLAAPCCSSLQPHLKNSLSDESPTNCHPVKTCKDYSTSPAEVTVSNVETAVLKCRSGRSSYSLRALKTVPFYYENDFSSVYKTETKKRHRKETLEANNNTGETIFCQTENEHEQNYINQLPDEILCMIFSYLPHLDILRSCSKVCHRWSSLAKSPSLRQALTFRGDDIAIEVVCGLVKFSPFLKSITIKDRTDVEEILPVLHQHCKRVETVNLVRCRPFDGSHRNLRAKSLYPLLRKGQLRSLNLKGTDYKSRKFYQMLGSMSNLRKLDISCSKSVSPQILNEIAKHTVLRVFKNKWHSHSIYNGPKSMTIQLPGKIDEWASAYNLLFQNVGKSLTTLEFYAAGINDAALSGLQSCKNLKKLSIYNANLFGSESMAAVSSLTKLQELLIHNAKLSTDDVCSAFQTGNLSDLKCLHLNDSVVRGSTDVSADECLDLVAGKCRRLLHLSFTKCPDITDTGVQSVLTNCSQLLSLDLNGGLGIAGQSFLLIPTNTPHLKLLVVEEDCSEEKNKIIKGVMEKHDLSVQTVSTWKHRTKSYYL